MDSGTSHQFSPEITAMSSVETFKRMWSPRGPDVLGLVTPPPLWTSPVRNAMSENQTEQSDFTYGSVVGGFDTDLPVRGLHSAAQAAMPSSTSGGRVGLTVVPLQNYSPAESQTSSQTVPYGVAGLYSPSSDPRGCEFAPVSPAGAPHQPGLYREQPCEPTAASRLVEKEIHHAGFEPNPNRAHFSGSTHVGTACDNEDSSVPFKESLACSSDKRRARAPKDRHPGRSKGKKRDLRKACFHCGSLDHYLPECPTAPKCKNCGRKGHQAEACRGKKGDHKLKARKEKMLKEVSGLTAEEAVQKFPEQISPNVDGPHVHMEGEEPPSHVIVDIPDDTDSSEDETIPIPEKPHEDPFVASPFDLYRPMKRGLRVSEMLAHLPTSWYLWSIMVYFCTVYIQVLSVSFGMLDSTFSFIFHFIFVFSYCVYVYRKFLNFRLYMKATCLPRPVVVANRRTDVEKLQDLKHEDPIIYTAHFSLVLGHRSNPERQVSLVNNRCFFVYDEDTPIPLDFSLEHFVQMNSPAVFTVIGNTDDIMERINNYTRSAGAIANDRFSVVHHARYIQAAGLMATFAAHDWTWRTNAVLNLN